MQSLKRVSEDSRSTRANNNPSPSNYELLLTCYLSGQIPHTAWREHLQDDVFRAWLNAHGRRPPCL